MQKIAEGEIDPGFLITHKIGLEEGPDAYKMFQEKNDAASRSSSTPRSRTRDGEEIGAPFEDAGDLRWKNGLVRS